MNAVASLSPLDLAMASIPERVFVAPIEDTDTWLKARQRDVTASVAGALFGNGVHDYLTALELWAQKSGLKPPPEQTPAMRRGQLMEPVILQMLREEYPTWQFEQARRYYSDPLTRIGASPDFYCIRPDRPGFGVIDGKSVGKFAFKKGWKDQDGDFQIPLWIAIQVTVTAKLCGASWGAVAPLQMGDGGLDLMLEEIPLRPAVMDRLENELVPEFWKRVAEKRPYEPDWGKDVELVTSLYEDGGFQIDLGDNAEVLDLLAQREILKAREADGNAAAKDRKVIDAKLVSRLGNASAARVGGRFLISAKVVRRKGYVVEPSQYIQVGVKAS